MIENCGDNSYHWSAPLPEDIEKACPYHMYRVSKDIAPNFFSAMYNLQYTTPYQNHGSPTSKPGCWSYPDMLQIGNNMTTLESQTHYGAWCIVSSPLVLGTIQDLRHHFGPFLTHFPSSMPSHTRRMVPIPGVHAQRVLIGACNPMLGPIPVFNRTAMGGCYGWLLWVVAMGGC